MKQKVKTMKTWILFLLTGCILFTSCGQKQEKTENQNEADHSWKEIIERGTLTVCPLDETEELQAFSQKLMQQIADRIGISVQFVSCSPKEAAKQIKQETADLAFGIKKGSLGCSEIILNIDGQDYMLLFRKDDKEFAELITTVLQTMADDEILSQLSIESFGQDYSVLKSQFDTGQPSEEEAEEYDKRLKEMR